MTNKKETITIPLRPHHAMCLAFFRGKGYSEGFTGHMAKILLELQKKRRVVLQCAVDEICSACPNNCNKVCSSDEKVLNYDRAVLDFCGVNEMETIFFDDLTRLVQEKIIELGHREMICGDCQWNTICESQESRWKSKEY